MYRFWHRKVMEKNTDGKGGGGGGGAGDGAAGGAGDGKGAADSTKELADLKASNAALMERLDKLEGKKKKDESDDPDLRERARRQTELDNKKSGDSKALEAALTFNLKSGEWLKNNESLLPKDINDIFKTAAAEKFENAIEKDSAIKAGIVQSFFSVQANLDLLTPGLKNQLEDYLKLTKNGKQEKAQAIYDSIFEPAFEMLRRIKKAEGLNYGGKEETDTEKAYAERMMKGSRKHYLGEKTNA